jgi:hypothetical protein
MARTWDTIDYPVKDVANFQKLFTEYERRRERAFENPLRSGKTIQLLSATNHTFLPAENYSISKAGVSSDSPRNLGEPRQRLGWSFPGGQREGRSDIITLQKSLIPNDGRVSQLWLARSCEGHTLVVKIFMACLGPTPYWRDYDQMVDPDFIPEEELAHRECWAYTKLENLQGTGMPHSYGFYDVGSLIR